MSTEHPFVERLQTYLARSGMDLGTLARLLGVSKVYLRDVERGGRGTLSPEHASTAAYALGLSEEERAEFLDLSIRGRTTVQLTVLTPDQRETMKAIGAAWRNLSAEAHAQIRALCGVVAGAASVTTSQPAPAAPIESPQPAATLAAPEPEPEWEPEPEPPKRILDPWEQRAIAEGKWAISES